MSESKKTVFVVGLGPGGGQFLTVQAQSALQQAEVLCGYTVYIDLVRPLYPEKECYTTGMTREIDRCRWALDTARAGRDACALLSATLRFIQQRFHLLCADIRKFRITEIQIIRFKHNLRLQIRLENLTHLLNCLRFIEKFPRITHCPQSSHRENDLRFSLGTIQSFHDRVCNIQNFALIQARMC